MDYIVFGMGYGATLMVLGWALRTFGPGSRFQDADTDTPARADKLVYRMSWTRFSEALGALVATAGAAVIIITFLTALINPGDHAGSIVLWVCFGLVLVGTAVWTWFYVARYGAEGLVPARLDFARLLEKRERPFTRQETSRQPAQAAVSSSDVYGQPESSEELVTEAITPEYGESIDDEDDYLAYEQDDDIEMEVRYSRYQVHHPEEPQDDAYRDLFSMYGVEEEPDSDVTPEEDEEDGFEAEEAENQASTVPEDDVDDVSANDDQDAPDTSPGEDEPDEELPDAGPDENDDPVIDADKPLPDTPEGRAEALRRLQAWQPDEDA